jgi:hypothetical protein
VQVSVSVPPRPSAEVKVWPVAVVFLKVGAILRQILKP